MRTGYPFHGQLAQSVQPNPKCEGCLHYEAQRGQTGVCQVGLRPWNCGDGSAPSVGYAPLVGQSPESPGDFAPVAQADAGPNENLGASVSATVSLGEEHAVLVKSIFGDMVAREAESCPLHHQASPYQGQSNQFVLLQQTCSCATPSTFAVAKALVPQLSNRLQATLTAKTIVAFVDDVLKRVTHTQVV